LSWIGWEENLKVEEKIKRIIIIKCISDETEKNKVYHKVVKRFF